MKHLPRLLAGRLFVSVSCSIFILVFIFASFRTWNNFAIRRENVKTIVAKSIIGCLRVQKKNPAADCKDIFQSVGEIAPEVLAEVWVLDSNGNLIWQNTMTRVPKIETPFGQARNYTATSNGVNFTLPVPGGYIDDIETQRRVVLGEAFESNPLIKIRRMFFIFAIGLIVLATIISLFFSFLVLSRRAKEAKRVLRSLSDGDLSARFKIGRFDELSELSSSFNKMVDLLAKSLQEVKESEVSRKTLVGELSHDLRTPLTSMTSFIQLLQGSQKLKGGIEKECVDSISVEVSYLNQLVSNLFELSKIESPQTKADRVRMNLLHTLKEVEAEFSLASKNSSITFRADLPCEAAWILGDAVLAKRMFCNLIENSLRFAKSTVFLKGKVDYVLQIVTIEISDDGPGFSDELQKNFGMVPSKRGLHLDSDQIHVGLGSVISLKIVHLHEGKMSITNQNTGGAKVTITIPLIESARIGNAQIL